jgi:DNA-binding NtrC family response regulator
MTSSLRQSTNDPARALVLTGWGYPDYACAAAMALQRLPGAEVLGMSRRRLPEFLGELAESGRADGRLIVILGVSLSGDPARLVKAVRQLLARKVRLQWISVLPPSPLEGMPKGFKIDVVEADTLTDAVMAILGIEPKQQAVARILRLLGKKPDDTDLAWTLLIESAASRYRRFQDELSYGQAIQALARGTPRDEMQQAMVEEYQHYGKRELKGRSEAVTRIQETVQTVGRDGRCRVLITGETGTGKETVAYLIHGFSPRSTEPFIAFNCADLAPQLIESRLFGHEKGAFTGAEHSRLGAFDLANGGTLFLDEVAELSAEAQAGLLRVIQGGRFFRLGGGEVAVDVRVIAATNRDLFDLIRHGRFREDLYYRLNVINIHIPPLRERPEDIAPIAETFLRERNAPLLTREELEILQSHRWPGNVRELENVLERSLVLGHRDFRRLMSTTAQNIAEPEPDDLAAATRLHAARVLAKYDGNKTRAAKAMGVSVNTLKKYLGREMQ